MLETHQPRETAQKAILDLISEPTGLPIALYSNVGGHLVPTYSEISKNNFEPHCNLIQTFRGGKAACDADQCNRAQQAIKTTSPGLTMCHAGLWNDTINIKVPEKGDIQGVLMYGEMLLDDDEHLAASLRRHEEAVEKLQIPPEHAAELRRLLLQAKRHSKAKIESLRTPIITFQQWFYTLVDEETKVLRGLEKVLHELQTRIQQVLGNAENLANYGRGWDKDEVEKTANEVYGGTLALNTVIHTASDGDYLQSYDFKPASIRNILREAKQTYQAEAISRGIRIELLLDSAAEIEPQISWPHFKIAINNLVHNAVKYSFSSRISDRYVRISSRSTLEGCFIVISNYGVGILPEEISTGAIFERKYQGKLTQGEYRTGSGLGLFFAANVISRHQGRIVVESKLVVEDDGVHAFKPHHNKFTVFVPLRHVEQEGRG